MVEALDEFAEVDLANVGREPQLGAFFTNLLVIGNQPKVVGNHMVEAELFDGSRIAIGGHWGSFVSLHMSVVENGWTGGEPGPMSAAEDAANAATSPAQLTLCLIGFAQVQCVGLKNGKKGQEA